VTPILYVTNMVVSGGNRYLAYIIGLPPDAAAGKPWRLASGSLLPGGGETVIDRGVAAASGVGIGDAVKILGQEFTISGLSEGTANIVNSIAFISLDDFMRLRGSSESVSYLLVQAAPGVSAEVLAARIDSQVPGVTALSRTAFAQEERRVVSDMSTDVIAIMNLVGFLIGLAVMALTVYTATLARRAEYGVLKAVGARSMHLYRSVIAQAFASVGLGFAVGVGLTLLLSAVVPVFASTLTLEISSASVLKVAVAALVIAAFSAVLPIQQIAALDPAVVFRRRVR
jgi:putative ABC transport system permease protein